MSWCKVATQAEFDAAIERRESYIELTAAIRVDINVPPMFVPTVKAVADAVVRLFKGRIEAWGTSHVEAWGSSHVVAWGSSHVEARESSHVEAWESSHVEAWESSHVVAWESSHVEAWESSHVEARGLSHVEAWESSHVVAWESSHVEAWGNVALRVRGDGVEATAAAQCSVILHREAKCAGGVQVVATEPTTVAELCEFYGVDQASLPNQVEVLDKIRDIVTSKSERLDMSTWHGPTWDENKPACEETECGTTHCLAGWAQVLCENPVIRKLDSEIAGRIVIPAAAAMFTVTNATAMEFLQSRRYAVNETK